MTQAQPPSPPSVTVLVPVYNDWAAVSHLLRHLDGAFAAAGLPAARVLLIDDGSTEAPSPTLVTDALSGREPRGLSRVDVLHLRRNLGHQRAIAIGLSYIEANVPCDAVVVMDGDGEDAPEDIPALLARFDQLGRRKAVFAERARRTEKLTFRLFYRLYKGAHLLLTGRRVQVGNFSVVPAPLVARLVVVSDLWNHYAAAVFKARLPIDMVPLARGHRYAGESRMNFVSLVIHGLSAMSVYGDSIGVRLLTAVGLLMSLFLVGAVGLGAAWALGAPLPRWTGAAVGVSLFLLVQMLLVALVFVFIVLAGRDSSAFLPVRDHVYYISSVAALYRSSSAPETPADRDARAAAATAPG
jgi:hypothetical protein